MNRIAVFSDIQGNLEALNSILYDIDKNKYDEIICLGDIVGIGPSSKECLDIIKNRKDIKVVLGNHELYQTIGPHIKKQSEDNRLHEEWVRSSLTNDDITYLNSLSLTYDKLLGNNLFTFAHFIIEDDNKDYPYMLFSNPNEMVKKALEYPSNYIFVGHLHKNVYVSNKKTSVFVLGSSGCTLTNVTSYTEIIYDNELMVNTKYVTYDRKLYDRKVREIDFPYTLE